MIIDAQNLFDTAAALTTTAPSTNIIDLGTARDIGLADNPSPKIDYTVTETFQSTASSTLTISIEGSTDATTWDTYWSSPAIAKAKLVAGFKQMIDVPPVPPQFSRPQYLRLNYTVGTADFTAGKHTAALVLGRQANIAYPRGNTAFA